MTYTDEQIELEVKHIFESGENEIRFIELIKMVRDKSMMEAIEEYEHNEAMSEMWHSYKGH